MKNQLIAKILSLTLFLSLTYSSIFSQVNLTLTGGVYPTGTPMMGIAYGNGVYVAVGYTGYILKSTDGSSWTVAKNSSFLNITYSKVAFGNGLFVALSTAGNIVTSPDGTNWTAQVSGTANYLSDVTYASGKFMLVGSNNTTLTSTDGVTWTSFSIGAGATDIINSVFYAQGKFFIGVRENGTGNSRCYYSTTGATGTWSSSLIMIGGSLNKIQYLNNRFFAYNSTPNVYSSTDGISWSLAGGARLAAPNQIFTGFFDGLTYFLFGNSTEFGYCSIFTSLDGINFVLQPQAVTLTVQTAAYLNGRYFLGGNEGLVSCVDGINWAFVSSSFNAVASNGTRYVGVGQNSSAEAAIQVSTDYSSWTPIFAGIIKPLNGITYGNGKFVAVGNLNALSQSTYAVSADGLVWVAGSTLIGDALRAVAFGNNKYVAVGLNGRIVYSTNGVLWTPADNGSGYNYYGVSFVNNYFVAVGGSPTNGGMVKVKYSADGIVWTDASPSIVGHFHSITYGAGKYVLVGRDNTVGIQKFFSITTTDITSTASYSAAVTVTTPEGELGTVAYGAVTYNNGNFTAVANLKVAPFSAYVLTSTDASAWTATPVNSTTRLRAVISDGTAFKAIGATPGAYLAINISGTLPLRLVEFIGRDNNGLADLSWKTAGEENTSRFDVERSDDGRNFIRIGQVAAKNTPVENSYGYVDATSKAGVRYYRIKMIDRDEKFTYTQAIRIGSTVNTDAISLYPNPVMADYFNLTLPRTQPATVSLFNNKGEQLLQKRVEGNNIRVNLPSLAAGMYIVQVVQGDKTYTEKIVKK